MFRLLRAQHDSAKKRYSKIPKLKTQNSKLETRIPKPQTRTKKDCPFPDSLLSQDFN